MMDLSSKEWVLILCFSLVLTLSWFKCRKELLNFLKALTNIFFIKDYIVILVYLLVAYFIWLKLGFWNELFVKESLIAGFLIFSNTLSSFMKAGKGQNVSYHVKQKHKDSFLTIGLFSLFLELYESSFVVELILFTIGVFFAIASVIYEKDSKFDNPEGKIALKFSKFVLITIGVISLGLAILNFKENPTKLLDINQYKGSIYTFYLGIITIPYVYITTFFRRLNGHSNTMKFSMANSGFIFNWKLETILKTKLNLNKLEIFLKIPYFERMEVKSKKGYRDLLDRHFNNEFLIPTDHMPKIMVLDKTSCELILNDSFLKRHQIDWEHFVIPYEVFIEYSILNAHMAKRIVKKEQDVFNMGKIKILSSMEENKDKIPGEESYLNQQMIEWDRMNKKEFNQDISNKYKNLILKKGLIDKFNRDFMNNLSGAGQFNSVSFKEFYEVFQKSMGKQIDKYLKIRFKTKPSSYTIINLLKCFNLFNWAIFLTNNNIFHAEFGVTKPVNISGNVQEKDSLISAFLYSNSFVTKDKDLAEYIGIWAKFFKLNIEVVFWDVKKNKLVYINGKR